LFGQSERIQKGDLLEINVYGHPDLSKVVMVQKDGSIDYPFISNVPIDGMRLEEFQSVVTTQVARTLGERPIVTVWFAQTLNIAVTVLGQVNQPGQYPVSKQATLQGAISRAGGFTPRAELDKIQILRKHNGTVRRDTVNLAQFFLGGDLALLPELENGDVILVPGMPGSYDVKVLGAVRLPGGYPVQLKTNLLDLLFMAGGPLEKANLRHVRVYSATRSLAAEYSLDADDLFKGKAKGKTLPDVLPGDVVYVPEKGKSIFSILRDITTVALPVVMVLYYTGLIDIRR
jgi:polysaccharide export outer membrane protein